MGISWGKVETGETHETALKREINEELKLDIVVGTYLMTVDHSYPDFRVDHAYIPLRTWDILAGRPPTDRAFGFCLAQSGE